MMEVARFLLAEKHANFPDPRDVLHGRTALTKRPEVQAETSKFYRPRMCVRYDGLNLADN